MAKADRQTCFIIDDRLQHFADHDLVRDVLQLLDMIIADRTADTGTNPPA